VYAGAGIPEYWIVNLVESLLEVHRDPGRSGYRSVATHRRGETVAPLVAPSAEIEVAELLP
jgi:Uma2 family endonuclease